MKKPVAGFNANPQNINKNGAPKKEWTMKGLIEEALEEEDQSGTPYKKLIARKLRSVALKGDVVAIKEINNRLDGMPKQELGVDGDLNLTVNLVRNNGNS